VAHVCCKANGDACHTVAILDAAHGSIQQPAHNPVAVQTYHSQRHFLPYMTLPECDATTHHIITHPLRQGVYRYTISWVHGTAHEGSSSGL